MRAKSRRHNHLLENFMKILKKLAIAIVTAAMIMSSAAIVLADETAESTTAATTAGTTKAQSTTNLSNMTFDSMYGNQLPKYLNRQYEFDGEKIPVTESNYYYLLTFMQLSQYASYGYLPSTNGGRIDLTANYGTTGKTCGDYLVEQSEKYLHSTYIIMKRAKEAGLSLTDEDKKTIDNDVNTLYEQQAKSSGLTLDKVIKIYFGPQCDEQSYRKILENSQLAGKYQKKFVEEFNIPEDQKNIPSITYALHYAPESSASADDKAKAKAAADEMLGKCKTIDDLKKLGTEAKSSGVCKDAGTVPVQKGKMVPDFEAWAYGAERKEGEMAVIYAKEYGYFCVGYNGKVEIDASEKQDMANKALSNEVEKDMTSGKYGFKFTGTVTPVNTSNVLVWVFGGIAAAAVIVLIVVSVKTSQAKKAASKKGKGGKKNTKKKGTIKIGSSKKTK